MFLNPGSSSVIHPKSRICQSDVIGRGVGVCTPRSVIADWLVTHSWEGVMYSQFVALWLAKCAVWGCFQSLPHWKYMDMCPTWPRSQSPSILTWRRWILWRWSPTCLMMMSAALLISPFGITEPMVLWFYTNDSVLYDLSALSLIVLWRMESLAPLRSSHDSRCAAYLAINNLGVWRGTAPGGNPILISHPTPWNHIPSPEGAVIAIGVRSTRLINAGSQVSRFALLCLINCLVLHCMIRGREPNDRLFVCYLLSLAAAMRSGCPAEWGCR